MRYRRDARLTAPPGRRGFGQALRVITDPRDAFGVARAFLVLAAVSFDPREVPGARQIPAQIAMTLLGHGGL
jgi:hypothetical protein